MISNLFLIMRQNTLNMTGSGMFTLALFLLLMVLQDRDQKYEFVYPVYALFLSFVWYLPFAYLWSKVFGSSSMAVRLVTTIPIAVVIALVVSFCASRVKGKEMIIVLIGFAILMYYNSDFDSENYLESFYKTENVYGLPQDVIDVCDLVLSEEEAPVLIVNDDDQIYFRQYSSRIKLLFGNNLYNETMRGATEIPGDYWNMAALLENTEFTSLINLGEAASRYDVDYIVINTSTHTNIYNEGEPYYTLYASVGEYAIYKNNSLY